MNYSLHIDDIKAMALRAHKDEAFRESLFEAIANDTGKEASYAAWTLTHLPKTDIEFVAAHREMLAGIATTTPDISLRRISLSLLERIDWSMPDIDDVPRYYVDLLDFTMEHLMMADEPYGVRSICMKLAYKLSHPYPELLDELKKCLLMIEPSDIGKGVRCTRNKILYCLR